MRSGVGVTDATSASNPTIKRSILKRMVMQDVQKSLFTEEACTYCEVREGYTTMMIVS